MSDKLKTWEEAVLWLKAQPAQQWLVHSCFYDDPLFEAAERFYNCPEWRTVRRYLPEDCGKALDIGAGLGISSYALARDGWETYALEPDPSEIVGAGAIRKLSNEANLNIHVAEEFGEKLPFADETFDLVYCRAALHHAHDLLALCKEIGRVLKKCGRLIATREHVISKKSDLAIFLKNHPLHQMYGGENAYLLEEYKSAIHCGGIKIERVLNPFSTDINLFPEVIGDIKARLAGKVRFPFPELIPDIVIHLVGSLIQSPGRLYTFIGSKI